MSNISHVDSLHDTEVRAKAVQLQEDKENNRAIIKLIIDSYSTRYGSEGKNSHRYQRRWSFFT